MVGSPAQLSLEGQRITVRTEPGSSLLVGEDRLLFVNLLGFKVATNFPGYFLDDVLEERATLIEIVEYLAEKGVQFSLDVATAALLETARGEKERLVACIEAGRRLKEKPPTTLAIPGFVRALKPYQVPAVAHLVTVENGANFSVPGSGKTSIVLAAYSILRQKGVLSQLVVVGPRSSFMPWEEEFRACFGRDPDSTRLIGGRPARERLYEDASQKELILLTYQMASNDADDISKLLRSTKTMLVLDESHNIKRIAPGKWVDTLLVLAPHAARRVVLSGTPVPNEIADLWSQVAFLWPNDPVLGPRERFRYRAENEKETIAGETRRKLYPLYWRIRKQDLGLPKPRFRRIPIEMSKYQAAIYRALAAKILADVVKEPKDRIALRAWRKAKMVRMLQASSNPALLTKVSTEFRVPPLDASGLSVDRLIQHYSHFETPSKLLAAEKLIRRLVKQGNKVLVWSAFVQNIKTLAQRLGDVDPVIIHGDVAQDESENVETNREQIIRDFKTSDHVRVLIANPSACAESVSLHRACFHAVYFDRTFNAAHYMQSLDRIHRVGLEKKDKVYYYILQSENSIDQIVDARLEEKIKRMLALLEDDFAVLNLESPEEEFSEEVQEEADFKAFVKALRSEIKK